MDLQGIKRLSPEKAKIRYCDGSVVEGFVIASKMNSCTLYLHQYELNSQHNETGHMADFWFREVKDNIAFFSTEKEALDRINKINSYLKHKIESIEFQNTWKEKILRILGLRSQ